MAYPVKPVTLSYIAKATGGKIVFGDESLLVSCITTDSRDCSDADLFIALPGENFDSNKFIPNACASGAKGYMSSGDCSYTDCGFALKVENTAQALADIAASYRAEFDIDIVGITGSVGKTTTKEMVASVLETEKNVIKTQGNFNNHIGLPLTLLGIRDEHNTGVIEMGMSNFGEISFLTNIAKPHIAVITNIGESHIEYLGSREGILRAKCEIFEGLDEDGIVILNGDDEYLFGIKGTLPFKMIYYGIENAACDIVAGDIKTGNNGISFTVDGKEFTINLLGKHNVLNALCAIAVGKSLGLSVESIQKGLASYKSGGIRQNITEKNGITVITDCYNAAPTSVKAAIGMLCDVAKGRKIAVLGDMAELGENSAKYHKEVGAFAKANNVDVLVLTGGFAEFTAEGALGCDVKICESNADVERFLSHTLRNGDTVLFKASRVVKLEEVANKFN